MPGTKRRKYYWDASLFLAWLKNEPLDPSEIAGIEEVVRSIHGGKASLFTSVTTQSEVLESRITEEQKRQFENLFKRRNVVMMDVDIRVASLGGQIRNHYAGHGIKVSTPDSWHLATALHFEADELHSTDHHLLRFNGDVAGHKLNICVPISNQPAFVWGTNKEKFESNKS
jgi:predicted nucleic acid-binding protein